MRPLEGTPLDFNPVPKAVGPVAGGYPMRSSCDECRMTRGASKVVLTVWLPVQVRFTLIKTTANGKGSPDPC